MSLLRTRGAVRPSRAAGFTLVELLVVIAVIALLIGILLPALASAREAVLKTQNASQLRSIHRGCVIFGTGNDGWFPGRDSRGRIVGLSEVAARAPELDRGDEWEARVDRRFFTAPVGDGGIVSTRFAIMLTEELVEPQVLVAPKDPAAEVAASRVLNMDLDMGPPNHSYASLEQIGDVLDPGLLVEQRSRAREWRNTGNNRAILFCDRSLSATPSFNNLPYYSVWTSDPGFGQPNDWQGNVVRADNSTTFETSHIIANTQYGTGRPAPRDDIFSPIDRLEGDINGMAMMIWN